MNEKYSKMKIWQLKYIKFIQALAHIYFTRFKNEPAISVYSKDNKQVHSQETFLWKTTFFQLDTSAGQFW